MRIASETTLSISTEQAHGAPNRRVVALALSLLVAIVSVSVILVFARSASAQMTPGKEPPSAPAAPASPQCGPDWVVTASPNVGTADNELRGIAAISASDVWAVGYYDNGSLVYRTLIEHWNGTSWSHIAGPNAGTESNLLLAVAAVTSNDVWAVGSYRNGATGNTLVEHWNGTAWSIVPSANVGTNGNGLYGVSAVSANDIWAVGTYNNSSGTERTLVEHWDGALWSHVASPTQRQAITTSMECQPYRAATCGQ